MTLFPIETQGTHGASLVIRWVEKDLEVFLRGGGYIGGVDSPKLTIRWDVSPAKDEYWSPSATGDAAFARYPGEFIERAMTSSRVVIRVHEFRAPATAIYDLNGLTEELDKLPDLKKAIAQNAQKNAAERAAWKKKVDREMAETDTWIERTNRPLPKELKIKTRP